MTKPKGTFFPLRPQPRKRGKIRLSSKLRSIQLIITLTFTAVTVAVAVIVSIMLYGKFANTAEENANLNMQQIIEQVNYNLELYVKGMGSIFETARSRSPRVNPLTLRCSMNAWTH
jgi:two-component system sensor histidine kinase YesM